MNRSSFFALALTALASSCSIGKTSLAKEPPPLHDLEEPLELQQEPKDEDGRRALPPGSFTGIEAADRASSLDALLEQGDGILVSAVIENSPADQAGVVAGDAVLEARVGDKRTALKWPSEWRALEIATPAGAEMMLVVDRAGSESTLKLTTQTRVRAHARVESERFREEVKVGVTVRTATEVEARAAGLGPGAGAVVVGLARGSPWRKDGIVYMDLIVEIDGVTILHPQVLLDAIRAKGAGERVKLRVLRGGIAQTIDTRVSERDHELSGFSIPLIYSYSFDRGYAETAVVLGLYYHESTKAFWRTRILWFIHLSGGDSDKLEEESP